MYYSMSQQSKQRIEEKIAELKRQQVLEAVEHIIEFNSTPSELKKEMDKFVIGQEKGKKIIATAIAFHYKRLGTALKEAVIQKGEDIDEVLKTTRTPKANILIVGPTGCGKTYTAEIASMLVGVPFAVEDLTKFSEVGYVGMETGDILVDLLIAADGNSHVAQMGIVYLDEIDKILTETLAFKDVSGKGVQKGLLKLVEGMDNIVKMGKERIHLSTKHVLFIAGGVFEDIESIVKKRMAKQGLLGNWKDHLMAEDLVKFGMERQLMGRFPVKVVYDQLTIQDLKDIMTKSEDSPLKAYVNDLKAWDIDLVLTDDALTEISRRAEQEGTGARGLTSILHRVLFEDMYSLPGNYTGELVMDEMYVRSRLR